ncbi:hypothetical protein G9G39_22630 [Cronobacter sp. EKM101R]|uniref:hypothetical protein n=1 Tax=Cronobacter TaxID=413496 RepID=UPI0013EB935E|nr:MULTISPECIES: hypothetical protein [Cronobacter]KAF6589097.1 hypothetical protein G9G39_22630 [Cronobacter sp. EKM101R]KAF6592385.1 hypothetical protein G9G38_22685 [Cronobacter sp. EKM102R]MDK1236483.1 hypothetical protein [Cronobacter turicensis]HDI3023915.1 hypothetical protein [Cronobacter turicensis]
MDDNSLLRNSSVFVAYMGCLGWGSAYFYGWGSSFYYGFPWWVVGAGVDDVARSLFYAFIVIMIFLVGWGAGIAFFLSVKRKNSMRDLSFIRLLFAILLLLIPIVIEFSVIKQYPALDLFFFSGAAALIITLTIRWVGSFFSVACVINMPFVRSHRIELAMVGFIIYFWLFSFVAGWYKPQIKKEYEMLHHNGGWYYVLARYDKRLILSKTFSADERHFLVLNYEQSQDIEITKVRTRL